MKVQKETVVGKMQVFLSSLLYQSHTRTWTNQTERGLLPHRPTTKNAEEDQSDGQKEKSSNSKANDNPHIQLEVILQGVLAAEKVLAVKGTALLSVGAGLPFRLLWLAA